MGTQAPDNPPRRCLVPKIPCRSIVACQTVCADAKAETFESFDPGRGSPTGQHFQAATDAEVDRAAEAAWEAFGVLRGIEPERRAALLDAMAERIAALGKDLFDICSQETGLGTTRVISERERTTNMSRMFARFVRDGSWCRACIERGDAARTPIPKPDLRRMLRPLGPVAVFGASNFPLAYSTAGGDTASALAAGCPVIVKGHPLHPGTGEIIALAIADAVKAVGLPAGTFSFLHAGGARERAVGEQLVKHPCVRAVGFTGSLAGGTAIERMGRERESPIPVFSEMGSTNPVFVLPSAVQTRGRDIADRLVASATVACGQMCTCPGLVFAIRDENLELLERGLVDGMNAVEPQVMLSPAIQDRYESELERARSLSGIEQRAGGIGRVIAGGRDDDAKPVRGHAGLLRTTGATFLKERQLREEIFGPATILVVCANEHEMKRCAAAIIGSLTGSIFAGPYDAALAGELQEIIELRVGRVIFNGVPTGVEVNSAMVHGGPYPATTAPHTTAQGVMAMERWCRPVCWQNAPEANLPDELKDANPLGIDREVDGVRTKEPLTREARAT
ncbi:MAG: aldehyde dehydrogenase (NADP(+)) [Leptolyngbya sp. PLA3]|nr:MAG: aldehyde dehydrogenase (NADP(+)) [Cyanobacteria bacterium CYA]MCE7969415.1 aldehyde dehydrogenase (NADP(+)) [Leptolyngbya sp. PL-A3]